MAAQLQAAAQRPGHRFYVVIAVLAAVVIFAGFARTFYLNAFFARLDLSTLRIVHGVLFSGWILLLVAQTSLVAAHRTDLHRRLGIAGAVLAALMVIVGTALAIEAARNGFRNPGLPPPLIFFAVPFFDVIVFAILVAIALSTRRRRTDIHKRLMLVATVSLFPPAIARLPIDFIRSTTPVSAFGLTALALLAILAYDAARQRRVHPAYVWGSLFVILSYPLRMALAGTEAWQSFARWLVG